MKRRRPWSNTLRKHPPVDVKDAAELRKYYDLIAALGGARTQEEAQLIYDRVLAERRDKATDEDAA